MGDDYHKSGLYKWKRQTDPLKDRVYSRSQKITTTNDIQNWIQRVESASDKATQQVFGSNQRRQKGGRQAKTAALQTAEQLREHESALTEAHELLSQWMEEKVHLSDNDEEDMVFNDNALHQRTLQSNVKKEWDHLLENNYDENSLYQKPKKSQEEDPYAFLEDMDEASAVDSILKHMLQKKVVKDTFTEDLGLNEWAKHKDPRTKMQLRHQQVKENREKREKELEQRRKEQQAKKEAHHSAKQIILREEKDKIMKAKKEEMEIRKEMAKIKKDMQEERRKAEEEKQRERMHKKMIEIEVKLQVEQEDARKQQEDREKQQQAEERNRQVLLKLGEFETRRHANNLKILHHHFSIWYNVVLERRIQMGKARALSDWKLILRAWNAWKAYVRSKKIDQETKIHEINVIQAHRKNQLAMTHHKVSLLKKYFTVWQQWVKQEQERKEMEHAQEKTRNKMAALLEAAASGRLNTERNEECETERPKSAIDRSVNNSNVDNIFSSVHQRPLSSHSQSPARGQGNNRDYTKRIPTEAWQVTKKHLNLTLEEMAMIGAGENDSQGEHSDVKVRRRFGTQPWMNTKYITNNFENRHNNQQKILKEQQKQLEEQRHMIEELRFQQQQQMLSQQAKNLQEIQTLIQNQPPSEIHSKKNKARDVRKDTSTSKNEDEDYTSLKAGLKDITSKTAERRSGNSNICDGTIINKSQRSGAVTDRSGVSSANSTSTKTNSKYLAQLKKMEERAAERARLKAEREEKRRQAEEEKLERLRQEEEELQRKQEEEKRLKAEAYREKKRLEKQREIERQQREEKFRQQTILAEAHYTRSLLKYKGLVRFKKLVEMARQNEVMADRHYKHQLKWKILRNWHQNVQEILMEKERLANKMHQYLLVKHCFNNWRKVKHHISILEGRAKRFYQRNMKSKIFQAWYQWAMMEKIRSYENKMMAEKHYIWLLKSRSFKTWQKYPEELRKEKEREKRRKAMRETVAALLPDFGGI